MRSKLLLILLMFCAAASAQAAHTRAKLVLAADTARPGETVWAGVHLQMDAGWHTYWKNSGASGLPTSVQWDLPAGITAGEIHWPVPEKIPPKDLTTYGYEKEVVLLVPLKVSGDLSPGSRELRAKVSWLECQEQCIPGSADVSARLNLGPETKASTNAALIQTWQRQVPQSGPDLNARAWWESSTTNDMRRLILEWKSPASTASVIEADLYPYGSDRYEVQGDVTQAASDPGIIRIRKTVKKFEGDWPQEISGLLIEQTRGERAAYEVKLRVIASNEQTSTSSSAGDNGSAATSGMATGIPGTGKSLWRMLLYAFFGGMILNVMPCVLPVISLKILGFVGEARSDPRHVRKLGLIYALGVLVSFLALAALVIGIQAAGHRAGWGMQFSSPQFIVALTVLITLVALNLFGLFEVNVSGHILDRAGGLASRQGSAGAFFNGILATVLATPCTAPLLGTALGFAFLQPPPMIVLMFVMVGLGLAFPYVLLSWQPAWLKYVPKPGAWMENFKIAMGFPMLATAVWLFSLTWIYYGKRAWWLGIFLVIAALAAWVYGRFIQRPTRRRGLAWIILIALIVGGYAYAVESRLNWREPLEETAAAGQSLQEDPEGIPWQRWNPEAVAHAQEEGQPVLVDFTADWCVTCQANKRLALDVPSVRAKLKEIGAVAFLGDYTRFPPRITQELNRYGRAGVPLVLVYPGKAGAQPIVLPELLTPGIVLNALEQVREQQ